MPRQRLDFIGKRFSINNFVEQCRSGVSGYRNSTRSEKFPDPANSRSSQSLISDLQESNQSPRRGRGNIGILVVRQ